MGGCKLYLKVFLSLVEFHYIDSMHLEPIFRPINELVSLGAGQSFDHSNRISYYQSSFFWRKNEKKAIIDFCKSDSTDNFLQIKSRAGYEKGALISSVIEDLINEKNQVLSHFCGSRIQNSLQAILYHFILQGNKLQYWENKDPSIKRKLERLPSKNIDGYFHIDVNQMGLKNFTNYH
jgi:hypothetical protein